MASFRNDAHGCEGRSQWPKIHGRRVYNIFTNEQLAAMVTKNVDTKAALLALEGVGETRVRKYGEKFLSG